MKTTWMTMIFAAAVIALPSMAQELKATIPFDFSANGKHLQAGTYSVTRLSGNGPYMLWLMNQATKKSTMIVSTITLDGKAVQDRAGQIVFQCQSGICALAQVHPPAAQFGRAFSVPRTMGVTTERTVAIHRAMPADSSGF